MLLFLPFSPNEVMKEVEKIIDLQHKEKKPSSWVYNECTAWEDRNRFQIVPVYGKFYHISSQARRISESEITAEQMRQELQRMFRRYWDVPHVLGRFLVGAVKLIGIGLLFTTVGVAHYGLSALMGTFQAAAIIIGLLLAVALIPPAAREAWSWYRKRDDDRNFVYQQTILQRLRMIFFSRCPKCGKYFGDLPLGDDGSVRCSCGFRIERKPPQ